MQLYRSIMAVSWPSGQPWLLVSDNREPQGAATAKIDMRLRPGILLAGKVGGDSFEWLTHSTGQRISPSLLMTLTIKVILSDGPKGWALSSAIPQPFRRNTPSESRP